MVVEEELVVGSVDSKTLAAKVALADFTKAEAAKALILSRKYYKISLVAEEVVREIFKQTSKSRSTTLGVESIAR